MSELFRYAKGSSRVTLWEGGSFHAYFSTWGFCVGIGEAPARETLIRARAFLADHGKQNPDDIKPVLAALDEKIAGHVQPDLFA